MRFRNFYKCMIIPGLIIQYFPICPSQHNIILSNLCYLPSNLFLNLMNDSPFLVVLKLYLVIVELLTYSTIFIYADNHDGSIDVPVEDGDTLLHLACLYGHLPCVQVDIFILLFPFWLLALFVTNLGHLVSYCWNVGLVWNAKMKKVQFLFTMLVLEVCMFFLHKELYAFSHCSGLFL